jgi:hypothetical protein
VRQGVDGSGIAGLLEGRAGVRQLVLSLTIVLAGKQRLEAREFSRQQTLVGLGPVVLR